MSNLGRLFAFFLLGLFLAKTSAVTVFAASQVETPILLLAEDLEDQEGESETDFPDAIDEFFSEIQAFKLIQSGSIFSSHFAAIYRFNTYPSEYLEKALRPPCN
jgi:hypothetical protein